MGVVSQFRAASTDLLDRFRWARSMGATFGGARDIYNVLGYDRELTIRNYRERYARGGIAKRIVDVFPNATWRGLMEIIEDEDPKVRTEFEQAWGDIDTKHQLQAKLHRVDKLSTLSTYAILLIGAPGELDTELPKGTPDKLLYFTPFIGGGGSPRRQTTTTLGFDADATIASYEEDPKNSRFGLPKTYQIKRIDVGSPAYSKPVHWSRVIHVAEGCLDNDVEGVPALEVVWNLLDDLEKVTGGGAEAFWLRANQGMHIDIDKDMPLADAKEEKESLKEQADLYKHQIQRMMRTRGVEITSLGSDVANFDNPADAILTQIAGAKGIPKRILTGSEMGELASSQDRENWRDQVIGRQKGYAGPYIVRPLIERMIVYGYLPEPANGIRGYEVKWPNISIMTEEERSAGAASWSTTASPEGQVFTNAEIRDKWYEMLPLSPEDIAKIKPASQPMLGPNGGLLTTTPPGAAVPDDNGEDVAESDDEKKKLLPFASRAAEEAVEIELIRVLETAIESNNIDVIDRMLGISHALVDFGSDAEHEIVGDHTAAELEKPNERPARTS